MSYQVVARKWRPLKFNEVVGQNHITETLQYAILNNRVAPVYLFTGIRGTGKTTLARILVKTINCLDPEKGCEPCNVCENCREIMEGKSPDIIEIDGASNNSVDDVRNIKENVSYSPVKSKYKVYIIDEVHMLSKSAFNALLKTLEEPPSHTVFILATTDPQKIPTTVLSRCQRYDLRRLSIDDVVSQMAKILDAEKMEYETEALYAIAREGEGSMRDSQTILEQLITFGEGKITESETALILGASDKSQLRQIVESIVECDSASAVKMVEDIYKTGKSIEKAARDILVLIHHIVLYSELKNHDFLQVPDEEKKWIEECSQKASVSDWIRLFRFWNDEYEKIKTTDFSLMIFEASVITASNFPKMADFKSFFNSFSAKIPSVETVAKEQEKVTEIIAENPAKVESDETETEIPAQPEEPVAEEQPVIEIQRDYSWKGFTDFLKEKNTFLYGAFNSIPYSEDDFLITVTISLNMDMASKDITESLKENFENYFSGRKGLEIRLERSEKDSSLYDEDEQKRLEYIENRKKEVMESDAAKAAEQLGFELKKIDVEEN